MINRMILPLIVLIPFSLFTIYALQVHGLVELFTIHFTTVAGTQIFIDLVIACCFGATWVVIDARKRGINPWPYIALVPFTGSIGLLIYLLARARTTR
jgi:hypothetical protein